MSALPSSAITPFQRTGAGPLAAPAATATSAAAPAAEPDYAIAGTIGAELAEPVNQMRQIVHEFSQTRRISRSQMLTLMAAVEKANDLARQSQQIARLGAGRVRQSHERIRLDSLIQQALSERAQILQLRGADVRQRLKPVEIIVDPGLLSSLLDSALDLAADLGRDIGVTLAIKNWPEHAVLTLRVGHTDAVSALPAPPDSLNAHLLKLTAQAMGVTFARSDSPGETTLVLEFARTVKQLEGLTTTELEVGGDSSFHTGTRPLAGHRVLLISNDPLVRGAVDEAARTMGLTLDSALTVEQAVRLSELELPHLIVIDERLRDDRFDEFRNTIRRLAPNFGFVEIADEANTFEISSWMSDSIARVSRDVLRAQLPSVLALELAKAV